MKSGQQKWWLKVIRGADIGLFLQQLLLNVDLQLEVGPKNHRFN
jgi:hypothetical protein